jgi:hypothetical protein
MSNKSYTVPTLIDIYHFDQIYLILFPYQYEIYSFASQMDPENINLSFGHCAKVM